MFIGKGFAPGFTRLDDHKFTRKTLESFSYTENLLVFSKHSLALDTGVLYLGIDNVGKFMFVLSGVYSEPRDWVWSESEEEVLEEEWW